MLNITSHLLAFDVHMIDGREAKNRWNAYRVANGMAAGADLLSSPETNMKLAKHGIIYGLSLAQARTSGVANVCPFSTRSCRRSCVAQNGNGRYSSAIAGRVIRTRFLVDDPSAFVSLLAFEIDRAVAKHGADKVGFRLNTFSDIAWEAIIPSLFADRPTVQFYDYTKNWGRIAPVNYHLTYSVSEVTTMGQIAHKMAIGHNVAVVFDTKRTADLPSRFAGWAVIDGDKSDARFEDPCGVIVGLRAKGRMTSDPFGMVRVSAVAA